ncbi:Dihydropteroate synthase [Raoultella terrigena]|uniref:Dihydropteroate synthase n=1 Tax=Raoultella terrigena TaxID=577 RepID=A0A485CLX8_RAOTE|nr:Dihydropteroate synthase [Raoultella terrigena]
MHMQGQPKTMQAAPKYEDVFTDVTRFFTEHIVRCERAGIAKDKLLLDRDSVSVKIFPIIMSCLLDSASSTILVSRCW